MQLPTYQEIETLHHKYAPTAEVFDSVFTHCQIVHDIAVLLLSGRSLDVDAELVRIGCLLHDIGVYPFFDSSGHKREELNYITHGIRGEEILRDEGFSETIWRFASHHTGVGLTKQDVVSQGLPLPEENFEAQTTEELLVMYADKFHSKTQPPYFNPYAWYKDYAAKFGSDKVTKFENMAEQFGIPDVAPLVEKYGHQIRPDATL